MHHMHTETHLHLEQLALELLVQLLAGFLGLQQLLLCLCQLCLQLLRIQAPRLGRQQIEACLIRYAVSADKRCDLLRGTV